MEVAASGRVVAEIRANSLRRASRNLLENAVKFGGRARVRVSEAGEGFRIDVDDEGPGIPASELERVLHPFQRLERSRNRGTGGTGLGLAIARTIAEANGGYLVLENRESGGLQASLVFPAG